MEIKQILELLLWSIAGLFIAYRLTHDIVSGSEKGTEIDSLSDEIKINSYIGEHDGFAGPFGTYKYIRQILSNERMPEFVHEGVECRYCFSFWASYIGTIPILFQFGILYWIFIGQAVAGIIALYYRRMGNFYGIDVLDA